MENIIQVVDKFEINGRGTVFCFKCPKWLSELNPKILGETFHFNYNDTIIKAKVIGIEQWAKDKLKPVQENDNCGFLISEI